MTIIYFLFNLLVHFFEVDDEVEHNREILVFKGIDSLPDTVLICHEVAFFEVYFFEDDIFHGVDNIVLYL